ncbi:MAG: DUF2071 domain-containing protein [Acidobacteriaceae bacterium]|nr:DUF2071 domain-containing protein [Acidobacteriaceae bacterium]
MLHYLQRHPFAVRATFRHSLVLTYALPSSRLAPLLPPGLRLDLWNGWAFLAIALVDTAALRPAFLPALCGANFFLAGYRIFVRHGQSLRGLRVLRSYANRRFMVHAGNLLTRYNYHPCQSHLAASPSTLNVTFTAPGADLAVTAHLHRPDLPPSSPFPDLPTARRFAGPMPYTFDYEAQTHSLVQIRGVRTHWDLRPVAVDVHRAAFLAPYPEARLANAFYVHDTAYRWEKGTVLPL